MSAALIAPLFRALDDPSVVYAGTSHESKRALEKGRETAPEPQRWHQHVLSTVGDIAQLIGVFDHTPDIVFSIKDRSSRYVAISAAIVERCSLTNRNEAIGRTAFDLFPRFMAERYTAQDRTVFRTIRPLYNNLDLTLYRDGRRGWCLTTKVPLVDCNGQVAALACLSRDLAEPSRARLIDERLAAMVDLVQQSYGQRLPVSALAKMSGLSATQLDRRMKRIFNLSMQQFIIKTRLSAATLQLTGSDQSIAQIAAECGFCDQAAFANQFRRFVGMSPSAYRKLERGCDSDEAHNGSEARKIP